MKFKQLNNIKEAKFSAWKNQLKIKILKKIPLFLLIVWYVGIFYLFFALIFKDYSLYMVGFAFGAYFLYEKIKDDYIEFKVELAKI